MNLIVAFVLLACVALQQSSCQDVELRNGNDKANVEGGAQSRTIYSPRTLSPHRMMHFGKRPEVQAPPSLPAPVSMQGVYDLYQPVHTFSRMQRSVPSSMRFVDENTYPYLFTIELDRGQTLQAMPADYPSPSNVLVTPSQHQPSHVYNYDNSVPVDPLGFILSEAAISNQNSLARQQAKQFDAAKFMRLMTDDKTAAAAAALADKENETGDAPADQMTTQTDELGNQQPVINVSSRSIRGNTLNIPKAYISTLMGHGRQGPGMSQNSMGTFGFNKKAEPKNNLFMHFGRK